MIGDIVKSEGVEFEVVWAGGEGLVNDRETRNTGIWVAPPRMYNKTGNHAKKKDLISADGDTITVEDETDDAFD